MQKTVSLTVNGKPVSATVEGRTLLVQFLREHLGLTGTHVGCDTSQCGACVVHVDGEAVKIVHPAGGAGRGRHGHDDRGRRHRRHAASDAGSLPRQPRAAMRLLHAGHGDERARPGQEQPATPPSARSANSSKAISAAAPAITTSCRRSKGQRDARRGATGQCPRGGGGVAPMTTVGTPVRRREDYRFLTGQGTYTDDINRPRQLYAVHPAQPARPCAAARHRHIGGRGGARASSRSIPAPTWRPTASAALPCGWQVNSKDGSPMAEPPHPVLAQGRVRHVGDPVAVVIAETLEQARDAAELRRSITPRSRPSSIRPRH